MSQGFITASIAERLKSIAEKANKGENITDEDIMILYLDYITVELKEIKDKIERIEKELKKLNK